MENILINNFGEKVNVDVKRTGFFSKGIGLMFKSRKTKNLLFEFDKSGKYGITSFFVFFPFLAVWLDEENNVVDKKIVKPFCLNVKPKSDFVKLVEIPLSSANSNVLDFLVDEGERFK